MRSIKKRCGPIFSLKAVLSFAIVLLLSVSVSAHSKITKEDVIKWIEENVPDEKKDSFSSLTGHVTKDTLPQSPRNSPYASLTVNGGKEYSVTVRVGERVDYAWSSENAVSATSYFLVAEPDRCGNDPNEVYPWHANTLSGSRSDIVSDCQEGATYGILYEVSNADSSESDYDFVIVRVASKSDVSEKINCQFADAGPYDYNFCWIDSSKLSPEQQDSLYGEDYCYQTEGNTECSFVIYGEAGTPLPLESDCGSNSGNILDGTYHQAMLLCPSVALTGNGNTDYMEVNVGDRIDYSWSSKNIERATSYVFVDEDDKCGMTAYNDQPWHANSPSGSRSDVVSDCQKGSTYTIVYKGERSDGAEDILYKEAYLSIRVKNPESDVSATFTANGEEEIYVTPGDTITYSWSSANADEASSMYFVDDDDACGTSSSDAHDWLANTLSGSRTDTVSECQAGRTYYIFYTAQKTFSWWECLFCDDKIQTKLVIIHVLGPNTPSSFPHSAAAVAARGDAPPSLSTSFKVNGKEKDSVEAGASVSFQWNSQGKTHEYFTVSVDTPDGCGKVPGISYEWEPTALYTTKHCEAGHTYTYTYRAINEGGNDHSISEESAVTILNVAAALGTPQPSAPANAPAGDRPADSPSPATPSTPATTSQSVAASVPDTTTSPPTATITVNGISDATVRVGVDPITYVWSTTNANSASVRVNLLEGSSDSCSAASGTRYIWESNAQSSSREDTATTCMAGGAYKITLTATNGQGTSTASVIVRVSSSVTTSTPHNPFGSFDQANCELISGWACDPDALNHPINLHLYKGGPPGTGQFVETILANQQREAAVGTACNDNGAHGFSFQIPQSLKNGVAQTLYLYGINTPSGHNPLIGGTSKSITCGTAISTTPPNYRSVGSSSESTLGVKNLATGEVTGTSKDYIEVSPGQEIEFAWSSTIGSSFNNMVITDKDGSCVLNMYPNGMLPNNHRLEAGQTLGWMGTGTPSGSKKYTVQSCDSGATYTLKYNALMSNSATGDQLYTDIVTVKVSGDSTGTRPTTTYLHVKNVNSGQSTNSITANVGDEIELSWGTPHGSVTPVITSTLASCRFAQGDRLDANIQTLWNDLNSLRGTKKFRVLSCDAGATYTINYRASNGGEVIDSPSVTVRLTTQTTTNPNDPFGSFDLANCDTISGWSCDPDALNLPISLHLYKDGTPSTGQFVTSILANSQREAGVDSACKDNGAHGFSISTPLALKDGQAHTLNLYGINTPIGNNPLISGSGKTITCAVPSTTAILSAVALRNNQQIDTTEGDATLDVLPGDSITYTWSSTNSDSASSTYKVNSGTTQYSWLAATTSGSRTDVVGASQVNTNYAISFISSKNGLSSTPSTITVRVGTPSTTTSTAILSAVALRNGNQIDTSAGDGIMRVGVGDRIHYAWSSTNANSYRATVKGIGTNTCGWGYGVNNWPTPNSLNGNDNNPVIAACQAGATYNLTFYARNGQNPEAQSSIILIVGSPPTALLRAANNQINPNLLLSSISAKPGENIRYEWSSSNADQFSSTYSIDGTGNHNWGVAVTAQGSDGSGTIHPSQAGKTYAITFKARNSTTGEEAISTVYVLVENYQKVGCINNVCFGAHSYVFPIKNGYGTYQPYPFFCKGGFTIDTRDGKYESTCDTTWQVQSGCTTPDGYTFPNCPAQAPTSRSNAQCVRNYCQGYNSRVTNVENAQGTGAGNPAVICDGSWWVDTRGSTFSSSCATTWRAG